MSNPRRTNGSKRDKLVRRVKREESTCHLCGGDVDVRLAHGLPASPVVDEVFPIALGGSPYDRANCRLAHSWCNGHRGARPAATIRDSLMTDAPAFGLDGTLIRVGGATPRRLVPVVSREW